MKVLRIEHRGKTFYAALNEDHVVCLDRSQGLTAPIPLAEIKALPPVAPTKIVCLALNYKGHAEETGKPVPDDPLLFLKPPSAVIPNGRPIVLPPQSQRVDHEGELALILGKPCSRVSQENALQHLFGYCCANDVTARDLQEKDGLFARAKGFDTFAPIGPWIETDVADPNNLEIKTWVNGEIRQHSSTSDLIFPVERIVSFVSHVMSLNPGDVILTGTPPGVGPLRHGDEVRIEIPDVGVLINPVIAAEEAGIGAVIQ